MSYPKLTYAFQPPFNSYGFLLFLSNYFLMASFAISVDCKVSKDPRLINIHTTPPWLSSKYVSTTVQYTPETNTNDTKIFSYV